MRKIINFVFILLWTITALTSCSSKAITPPDEKADNVKVDSINKPALIESFTNADSIADSKVSGYTIKLIEGKGKFRGYTKVDYINTLQMINAKKAEAKKNMMEDKALSNALYLIEDGAIGGSIKLEIGRTIIDAANTDMFSIIIKDTNEKELYRKDLPSEVAETPGDDGLWWNLGGCFIPKKIRPPFFIYVVDKTNDVPFKFSVTPK